MIKLKGMTWDHDRGFNPLIAASKAFQIKHPNVEISWDKRSLQAFADRPLDVIAQEYDFMIIDHPHVGDASQKGSIIALDGLGYDADIENLATHSVGQSHQSYHLNGHQWALAVDAAAQVACYRPDLLANIPSTWYDVLELAKQGKVLFPLKPVDAIDSFFTLCANLNDPIAMSSERLVHRKTAEKALRLMYEVAQHVPSENLTHNPIDVLEIMATSDQYAYCPLLFGYTNYSRLGYRENLIKFTNIPGINNSDCNGSIIGGTGLAISSQTKHQDLALEFAFMVASGEFQTTEYYQQDGQPAHRQAWLNKNNNNDCADFFKDTLLTLDQCWLRPRYNGFLYFADKGGDVINAFLSSEIDLEKTISTLEEAYQTSLQATNEYNYE